MCIIRIPYYKVTLGKLPDTIIELREKYARMQNVFGHVLTIFSSKNVGEQNKQYKQMVKIRFQSLYFSHLVNISCIFS